jgi:plastocyanin domain-containing protein
MTPIEWTVIVGAGASIALVNWYFFFAGQTVAVAAPVMAMSAAGGAVAIPEVVITVDGGYSPNTVRAKAGERLRLIFDRQDDSSCSEEVVIPAFGIRTYLPTGQRTAIEVMPTEAGRIPFTCGMGMLKGTILVDA